MINLIKTAHRISTSAVAGARPSQTRADTIRLVVVTFSDVSFKERNFIFGQVSAVHNRVAYAQHIHNPKSAITQKKGTMGVYISVRLERVSISTSQGSATDNSTTNNTQLQ